MMKRTPKTPALAKLAMLLLFAIAAVAILDTTSISAQELGRTITSPFGIARQTSASESGTDGDAFVDPETGEVGHIIRNPFGVANPEGVDTGIDIHDDAREEVGGIIISPFGVPASDDIDTGVDVFEEDEEYLISLPDDEESDVEGAEDANEVDDETLDDEKEIEKEAAGTTTEKYVPVIDNPIPGRESPPIIKLIGSSGNYSVESLESNMNNAPFFCVAPGGSFMLSLVDGINQPLISLNHVSILFEESYPNGLPGVFTCLWNSNSSAFSCNVYSDVFDGTYCVSVSFEYNETQVTRCLKIKIVYFDLVVDSNNNGMIDSHDNLIEGCENYTGKIIHVNTGYSSDTGIPDYANGFNCINNETVGSNRSKKFTEIKLRVSQSLDLSQAFVKFVFPEASYSATRIGLGTATSPYRYYPITDGQIRLWRKDGPEARKKETVTTSGDRIPKNCYIGLNNLSWESFVNYKEATLFIEAVNPSDSIPGFRISANLYQKNGDLSYSYISSDEVHITSILIRITKIYEYLNKANSIFNMTLKDDAGTMIQDEDKRNNAIYGINRERLFIVADDTNKYGEICIESDMQPSSITNCMLGIYHDGSKCKEYPYSDALNVSFYDNKAERNTSKFTIDCFVVPHANAPQNYSPNIECFRPLLVSDFFKDVKDNDNNHLYYAITQENPIIYGINKEQYNWHLSTGLNPIINYGSIIMPIAGAFLKIFYNRGTSLLDAEYKPVKESPKSLDVFQNATATSSCFSEWLTHNSGADFDANGIAEVDCYEWTRNSAVSNFIKNRKPFALENILSTPNEGGYIEVPSSACTGLENIYYGRGSQYDPQNSIEALAIQYLQNEAVGALVTIPKNAYYELNDFEINTFFPMTNPSPAWVPQHTVNVGKELTGGFVESLAQLLLLSSSFDINEYDAFYAIGRARIVNPRYRFTVKKQDEGYNLENIDFVCDIEDLYDFNYQNSFNTPAQGTQDESYSFGCFSSHAAALQIEFGNKSSSTRHNDQNPNDVIYRHKIIINTTYDHPFDHLYLPSLPLPY